METVILLHLLENRNFVQKSNIQYTHVTHTPLHDKTVLWSWISRCEVVISLLGLQPRHNIA